MSFSIKTLPLQEKGTIFYTTTSPSEDKKNVVEALKKTEIPKIAHALLIDNHQSYDRSRSINAKEIYSAQGVNPLPFIVLDNPPSDQFAEEYKAHGPRNLVRLVNFLFEKVQKGENVLLDVNQQCESTNLIIAALARKVLACSAEDAIRWCTEKVSPEFNMTARQNELLKDMDFAFPRAEVPAPYAIPTLKGRIFRGVLTRDILFDDCAYLKSMKEAKIERVITLCEGPEIEVGTSTDLLNLYKEHGFEVIHFPIRDYGVPSIEKLKELISQMELMIPDNKNTMIHCWAGNGRTGLVLACYAKQVLQISGTEAVKLIRTHIPQALEKEVQTEMVNKF